MTVGHQLEAGRCWQISDGSWNVVIMEVVYRLCEAFFLGSIENWRNHGVLFVRDFVPFLNITTDCLFPQVHSTQACTAVHVDRGTDQTEPATADERILQNSKFTKKLTSSDVIQMYIWICLYLAAGFSAANVAGNPARRWLKTSTAGSSQSWPCMAAKVARRMCWNSWLGASLRGQK